jgi:hypothetical protein
MTYRIKNESTGALGWQTYETLKQARAQAKFHAEFHGVKVVIVDQNGNPLPKRRGKKEGLENLQMAVNVWNFGRPSL